MPKIKYKTGAYCWRNVTNGKVYVGGAYASFDKRRQNHEEALKGNYHHNKHLQSAWNKYGQDAFEWVILERCESVKEIVQACEQKWIDYYDAANNRCGYNVQPVAGSSLGCKHSPETKEKIAAAGRVRVLSDESKEAISDSVKADWASAEGRRKKMEAMRDPTYLANASENTKKMWEDPEYREIQTEHRRRTNKDPEVLAKISAGVKKTRAKPEVVEKVRLARIAQWKNPEMKKKMAEGIAKSWKDPVIRAKKVAAMKEAWVRRKLRELAEA